MDAHRTMHQPEQYYQLHDAPQEKAGPFLHQQAYQPSQPDISSPDAAPSGGTILPVKRSIALSVLAVVTVLLFAVIGLGAGLGVSQRDLRQAKGDLETAQAIFSSAILAAGAATTVFQTPTPTAGSAVPSATASAAEVQCPRVNGTVYTAGTEGKRFRRMCGIDYGGEGEAVDIGSVKTKSLDDCIEACAAEAACTGAGWGIIEGDDGAMHSCWMKTNLTSFHQARTDWGFAVLMEEK